jgi:uridylate kinase
MSERPDIVLPIVHSNGTGRDTLTTEYQAALDAAKEARKALVAVTVNGRDYYPAGPDAFRKAQHEHELQLGKLTEVCDHLERILEHLTTL